MIRAVFRLDVFDEKNRQKAQKLASRISGVKNVTVEGENLLAVVGDFDAGDAVKKLRKISNVAVVSVIPAGGRNKSNEGKAKNTEKQKDKIRDPLAEVSDSGTGSPPDRFELAQDHDIMSSRNILKEYKRKIKNMTTFVQRRKVVKFEPFGQQSQFSGAGGSKALQHKSEVPKSDTTGIHGGVRSHHDVEMECEFDVDRVDMNQGSGLSDSLSDLSLRDEIVKGRIDSPSDIKLTHLHRPHGLIEESSFDSSAELFTGTKSERENRLRSIIDGSGGSKTLESQYPEVETNIKDIPVASIHAGSVSEIEAEEDLGATSSLDDQSHGHIESSIVPFGQQSQFSGAGGSKALQHKSEVPKSDTTGIHGGVRSHHDVEMECEFDVDRVDMDQGSGLSDSLSDLSLRDEIVKGRIDSPSDIILTHLHRPHGLIEESSFDSSAELFTGTKSERENRLRSIIDGSGGSKTLESQYPEVETNIKDIPVASIHAGSVSEIEAEEDLGATSSLDDQSHGHIESSIVPHMQEMNNQIAGYLESIEIKPDMPRVIVNDQSPLLIKEDDITYLKSVYLNLSHTARECLSRCALVYLQEIDAKTLVSSCITDGVVDSLQEVFLALQALINYKLLLVRENRQSFMLLEVYRYILLDQVIPSKSDHYFLMKSGKGLTKPPDVEEWETSKEIHLMDNDLSELPENLNCPGLVALFLQRNYNLRVIPSTFFDRMPYLQVLNLSRTHIKTLPDSLFNLFNLRRLFLNRCDLLMMLPMGVGELRSLEVLDLEGTEVINLPNEIQHLTNLTSLKVAFCEPISNGRSGVADQFRNAFPWRTILTLSKLEELHIDVSPSDERWNADSEFFVEKLCGLKLWALKLYFPREYLLRNLKGRSKYEEFLPLMSFDITVGHHVRRIIPRIPHDAELELERYRKFLRYVNGKGFPVDVKRVLEHATAFVLDHHTKIRMLSELGFENMINLVCCAVGECNELETIHDGTTGIAQDIGHIVGFPSLEYLCLYYMKSLKRIWKGHLSVGLSCLKRLTIRTCLILETIFTDELLSNVFHLEELTVDDCPTMTSLVSCDKPHETTARFLPNLKKISLHYLPELSNLSSDNIDILSRVEWMSIYDCPALKSLPINKSANKYLKDIKGESSWWESLEWDMAEKSFWDPFFVSID